MVFDFKFKQQPRSNIRVRGTFQFGIEEEFFLADRETGELVSQSPAELFTSANLATEGLVGREFLQSQIEVATPPLTVSRQAHAELQYVRGVLARLASLRGLSLVASGTHPLGRWRDAQQSPAPRYDAVMNELQLVGRRNLFCGLHVHVELPDPSRRVELMGRLCPYLPLFLALSTSSPFWEHEPSGMKGYRLAAYSELPRSGLPEVFDSHADYGRYIDALVASGAIKDASYVWWMLRPSLKYPTLELRAADSCTRVEHTTAIAALYRCLVRHFFYHPCVDERFDGLARALAAENKWQAQRHGTSATFATPHGPRSVEEFLNETIALCAEDSDALGCRDDVERCRDIVEHGTSADAQLAIFARTGSLKAVADWLVEATIS